MPWSDVGAQRLAAALVDVDEELEHPLTVWWFDADDAQEVRGSLYGWRTIDSDRRGLVVARTRDRADVVVWVPEHLVRARRE